MDMNWGEPGGRELDSWGCGGDCCDVDMGEFIGGKVSPCGGADKERANE